ncbi:ClC family H(+)/Cl(-) exchange transporter [Convivina intestini]|uniref:ClC family H(+)/Cl(-) exchange transporter n=1 Tax=Convivina intestini TaxID=1505726 RepID=UPI00200DB451|nr:ClC family H(+)/Cl(-) exchange transporter [Convivina intestini]CAH1851737.1 H(+)/Cl(-) exchange transporter ClcA [Convivina intestini]
MIKKHFQFKTDKLSIVVYATIIGLFTGLVVSLFRFSIEKGLYFFQTLYIAVSHGHLTALLLVLVFNLLIGLIVAALLKKEPNISGSGIPQVEGQLMGNIKADWWSTLWRKFIAGILAIGSGLMLGREGPSIQLGSSIGQGLAQSLNLSHNRSKTFIASGAAAGLSAAFNAPLAGVMFVLEEIYHSISPFVWVGALVAASVADFVSTVVFGQKPVLALGYLPIFPVKLYGLLVILGIILGVLGFLYQKTLLFSLTTYSKLKLPKHWYGLIPLILIIPVGIFWPDIFGGGNGIILSLQKMSFSLPLLFCLVTLRFIFSMVSYGSGLPGGIFLPILTLGALNGALMGQIFIMLGWMPATYMVNFIVIGMAAYFACIGKAPFTAIILIVEMVGSITHILPLALVSLIAYLVVDIFNGAPIYTSLLQRLLKNKNQQLSINDLITIEIPVLAGGLMEDCLVQDLPLPPKALITLVKRSDEVLIPSGDLVLRPGDLVYLRLKKANLEKIKSLGYELN